MAGKVAVPINAKLHAREAAWSVKMRKRKLFLRWETWCCAQGGGVRLVEVAEISVVGWPDWEWGEAVVAFLVMAEGEIETHKLDAHCLKNIARFKRPEEYVQFDALPKNNYGKVLKTELRQMF